MCTIFADDTSLFPKLQDLDKSVTELNTDLQKICQWANQLKCNLILIPRNKQMQLFSPVN